MPPNYIANKPHRLPETEEIIRRIRDAQEKVVPVAKTIKAGRPLKSRHVWLLEWLIEYPLNPILGYFGHRIEGFSVEGTCVSCGVCEEVCPVNAIRMQEGKPVWKGKTCAHCMACIQNCPEESIEYKDITQGRKRYRLEDYRGLLQDEKIERTENMEA